jgi:hypothetical protein
MLDADDVAIFDASWIAAWPAVAQQIAAGEPLIEVSRRTPV